MRKFRLADSQQLHKLYQDAVQIQAIIEESVNPQKGPEDLPDSLIPTTMLYDLVSAYLGMYDLLLEHELAVFDTAKLLKTVKIN